MFQKILFKLSFILLFTSLNLKAKEDCFPKVDYQHPLVIDVTKTLSASQINALNNRLVAIDNQTSNQVLVVIVNDLCGMDKAMYATEIGHKLGVGDAKKDNGVVLLIKPKTASSGGKTFIASGYGLEGVLPDAVCHQIVQNELIPNLKQGKTYEGILAAINVIEPLMKGEFNDPRVVKYQKRKSSKSLLIIGVIILVLIIRAFKAKSYADTNHTNLWTAFMLGNIFGGMGGRGGSGSWDNFSGGGGGFGGFGGGGFGGGGAGGDW